MTHNVNNLLIRERAQEIRQSIEKIRIYADLQDEIFFADERNLYTIQHLLLICIEAVATICSHLSAKLARKSSDSYSDCFETLLEINIIDKDLAMRLIQMARFRNLLVHRYGEIDPKLVLQYARENLDDFERFIVQIGNFLSK